MSGLPSSYHCQPILEEKGRHERVPSSVYPVVGVRWWEGTHPCPAVVGSCNTTGSGKGSQESNWIV